MTWRTKDPDVNETYAIDWQDQLVLSALREFDFVQGQVVKAPRDTGWYYECTTAGKTARNYPAQWPRSSGVEVADGSVIWTCRHPADTEIATVESVDWQIPDGLALVEQIQSGRLAIITVSGGEAGVDYDVVCRMTPSVGNAMERTETVRVRSQ